MERFNFLKKKKFIKKGDPGGSYTGTNIDVNDKPEQDADDL